MIRTILALCSRDVGHDQIYRRLTGLLDSADGELWNWEELICEAERQGIAPLLYKHLASTTYTLPLQARRLLQSLYLRQKKSTAIRNNTLIEILTIFHENGVESLLLKGSALGHVIYQDPCCRPMRDIDILVKKEDVDHAQHLLFKIGFLPAAHPAIGDDHHHLVPLVKVVQGLPISIEVHRELLPKQLHHQWMTYEKLKESAMNFSINGFNASSLSLEDTLYYVYLHGFRSPLTYEPFRLIHVADLVSLVEKCYKLIDWDKVRVVFPSVFIVLSRLHFLTPWNPVVKEALSMDVEKQPDNVGKPYAGWPLRAVKEASAHGLVEYAKDTIWPSQWWVQMYYGCLTGPEYYKIRFVDHPRTLWRWAKTFWHSSATTK